MSPTPIRCKQKIVEATTDDTEYRTGYSFGWTYGTPHRVIPNRDKWNLLRLIGGGARAIDKPRMAQKLSLYAGQGVGKIHSVVPAAERVAELVRGLASVPDPMSLAPIAVTDCAATGQFLQEQRRTLGW